MTAEWFIQKFVYIYMMKDIKTGYLTIQRKPEIPMTWLKTNTQHIKSQSLKSIYTKIPKSLIRLLPKNTNCLREKKMNETVLKGPPYHIVVYKYTVER